jgi:hypothetical protein
MACGEDKDHQDHVTTLSNRLLNRALSKSSSHLGGASSNSCTPKLSRSPWPSSSRRALNTAAMSRSTFSQSLRTRMAERTKRFPQEEEEVPPSQLRPGSRRRSPGSDRQCRRTGMGPRIRCPEHSSIRRRICGRTSFGLPHVRLRLDYGSPQPHLCREPSASDLPSGQTLESQARRQPSQVGKRLCFRHCPR